MENIIINNADRDTFGKWVEVGDTEFGKLFVKNCIPYKEKIECAKTLVSLCVDIDKEAELIIMNPYYELYRDFIFISEYTNITEQTKPLTGEELMYCFVDWFLSTGLYDKVMEIAGDDFNRVECIYERMVDELNKIYSSTHSLSGKIMKTFSSLLNGEDLTDSIAKSEEITGRMSELLKEYRKVDIGDSDFDDEESSIKNGFVDLNGRKINVQKVDR